MYLCKPTYTVQKQHGRILLLRKLEPFERHYYKPNEYICDGRNFWLVLESTCNIQAMEWKLHNLKKIC